LRHAKLATRRADAPLGLPHLFCDVLRASCDRCPGGSLSQRVF
jgi:hypothetical protein